MKKIKIPYPEPSTYREGELSRKEMMVGVRKSLVSITDNRDRNSIFSGGNPFLVKDIGNKTRELATLPAEKKVTGGLQQVSYTPPIKGFRFIKRIEIPTPETTAEPRLVRYFYDGAKEGALVARYKYDKVDNNGRQKLSLLFDLYFADGSKETIFTLDKSISMFDFCNIGTDNYMVINTMFEATPYSSYSPENKYNDNRILILKWDSRSRSYLEFMSIPFDNINFKYPFQKNFGYNLWCILEANLIAIVISYLVPIKNSNGQITSVETYSQLLCVDVKKKQIFADDTNDTAWAGGMGKPYFDRATSYFVAGIGFRPVEKNGVVEYQIEKNNTIVDKLFHSVSRYDFHASKPMFWNYKMGNAGLEECAEALPNTYSIEKINDTTIYVWDLSSHTNIWFENTLDTDIKRNGIRWEKGNIAPIEAGTLFFSKDYKKYQRYQGDPFLDPNKILQGVRLFKGTNNHAVLVTREAFSSPQYMYYDNGALAETFSEGYCLYFISLKGD